MRRFFLHTLSNSIRLFLVVGVVSGAALYAITPRPVFAVFEETIGAGFQGIGWLIFKLTGMLLWLSGSLFNQVVNITVFRYGPNFNINSQAMLTAWGLIRDLANIGLIFGFIFLGIAIMLNLHGYEVRKTLPRLVIFAVLMNFSLLASQAIVDTSNITASFLYNQTSGQTCEDPASCAAQANYGPAGTIVNATAASTIFAERPAAVDVVSGLNGALYYLGLSLFFIILAVVLMLAAILFLARAIILVFLMILSPIGFAGLAVPFFEKWGKQWWTTLLAQSFFAPVFLVLLVIAISIMQTSAALTGGDPQALGDALINSGDASLGAVYTFAIGTGFVIFALMAAKQLSTSGSGAAIKMVQRGVGGAVYGSAGFVGRRTVGRWSESTGNLIRNSKIGETAIGRRLAGIADKGATSSFDFRAARLAGIGGGVDIGKPSKKAAHGFHQIEKDALDARVNYGKSLKGRTETEAERVIRVRKERELIQTSRTTAAAKVTETTTKVAAAETRQTLTQAEVNNQDTVVAGLKAQVAQNPGDADLQLQLAAAERSLTQKEQDLAQATEALATSRREAAAASTQQAVAQAARVDNQPRKLSDREQQTNYANRIKNQSGIPLPLGGVGRALTPVATHANSAAAKTILAYVKKSDTERAADELKAALKKVGDKVDAPAVAHAAPVVAAAAGGGGGGGGHGH